MHGSGQRSPPRGGADPAAANQQLLVDSDSGASGAAARSDDSGAPPHQRGSPMAKAWHRWHCGPGAKRNACSLLHFTSM